MPYIDADPEDKRVFRESLIASGMTEASAGTLNFMITMHIDAFIGPELSYDRINEAIGALECAKMELYRRIAVPYEEKKMRENGDVYAKR